MIYWGYNPLTVLTKYTRFLFLEKWGSVGRLSEKRDLMCAGVDQLLLFSYGRDTLINLQGSGFIYPLSIRISPIP